ncbi:MAG TPA: MBL fold metallo-hydrolase [Vicinamibacterales bacterium]|nr:MBL fold metallo-hydrolase [Vicinamibacterales bacterium]
MTPSITVATLREWLETRQPVTVIDVRAARDRAEWMIPGSVHVDAYDALRSGEAGALETLALDRSRSVVTVCYAGRLSQAAADILAARGYDARSLAGGMKAWSLAWNIADVPLPRGDVRVLQVRRTGKGCLSYLVSSAGEAVVIDASLPPEVYIRLAAERGWRIRAVIETHVHADHLSRARQLAEQTGAALRLPPQQRVTFPFTPFGDGDRLELGTMTITGISTPGHTDESVSMRLGDLGIFTGDTLFVTGVGRPDLHIGPGDSRGRAAALFASLRRLREIDDRAWVLSGHTSEPVPFDGVPVAVRLGEVRTWLDRWLESESAFVNRVTANLPATPPNFAQIVELNERGELPGDLVELEAGANRCAIR